MNCLQKPDIAAPNGDCWCVICEATRLVVRLVPAPTSVRNDFQRACLRDAATQLKKAVTCLELAGVNVGEHAHSSSLHMRAEQLLFDIHNEAKK